MLPFITRTVGSAPLQMLNLNHLQTVYPERLSDTKSPATSMATPAMQQCLQQSAPRQLQLLSQRLDAALQMVYKAMGLAACILAATAGNLDELKAAEATFNRSKKVLGRLATSLVRTDANAAATQRVKYLEDVIASILYRKRALLERLHQAQQLLRQLPRSTPVAAVSNRDAATKKQLADALAAVTDAQGAEVIFYQLPDGEIFTTSPKVQVNFGTQLVLSHPQEQLLTIVNKTAGPLQFKLMEDAFSSSSSSSSMEVGNPAAAACDLLHAIEVPKRDLLIASKCSAELMVVAGRCSEAGRAAATYLLSCTSESSCPLVEVTAVAEYQELSVTLDKSSVDFGVVATYKESVEQLLRVTNNTGVAVRVKSAVPPLGFKSSLGVSPADFLLQPYERDATLRLFLCPTKQDEVMKGAKLIIAANGKQYHQVEVAAEVQAPRCSLRLAGRSDPIDRYGVEDVPPLQPGQQQELHFELVNEGKSLTNVCIASGALPALFSGTSAIHISYLTVPVPSLLPFKWQPTVHAIS